MTLKTLHFLIGLCVGFMFCIWAYWETENEYMFFVSGVGLVISGAEIAIGIMANRVK